MCSSYNVMGEGNCWWIIILFAIILIWCCCGNNSNTCLLYTSSARYSQTPTDEIPPTAHKLSRMIIRI